MSPLAAASSLWPYGGGPVGAAVPQSHLSVALESSCKLIYKELGPKHHLRSQGKLAGHGIDSALTHPLISHRGLEPGRPPVPGPGSESCRDGLGGASLPRASGA